MRLLLVNPNTNSATTQAMVKIAQEEAGSAKVEGLTSPHGTQLIVDEEMLQVAADGVVKQLKALRKALHDADGVIVAAFGDPGVEESRKFCSCPVTGLGEAAIGEAAASQRSFAVVTTTPLLVRSIERRVEELGNTSPLLPHKECCVIFSFAVTHLLTCSLSALMCRCRLFESILRGVLDRRKHARCDGGSRYT